MRPCFPPCVVFLLNKETKLTTQGWKLNFMQKCKMSYKLNFHVTSERKLFSSIFPDIALFFAYSS